MFGFILKSTYFFLRQRKLGFGKKCYTVVHNFKSREWCEQAKAEISFSANTTEMQEDTRIFGVESLSSCAREFATDPNLLKIASEHAGGQESLIFCMANKLTYRGGFGSGGEWHRDGFRHEIKALLYLTDVTEADGPFAIVDGSHTTWRIFRDTIRMAFWGMREPTRLKDAGERFGYKPFTAPAGTLILFDASSIHAGLPISKGHERIAITNYYVRADQIDSNLAYYRDKITLNNRAARQ